MPTRDFAVDVRAGAPSPALDRALAETVPALIRGAWLRVSADCSDTGDYRARITAQDALRYPFSGDPDAVAIVNTSDHAEFVEDGHAAFHLPSRWGTGRGRWLVGKSGNLYARVPFRTATPPRAGEKASAARLRTAMPAAVYALATQLGTGQRLSDLGPGLERFEGLFQGGEPRTPGGGTQSQYLTIRTITPDSPGWNIPAAAGHHYAEAALDLATPAIAAVLDAAAASDLSAAMAAAVGDL